LLPKSDSMIKEGGNHVSRKLDAAIAEGLGKDVRWKKWETRGGFDVFTDASPGEKGADAYFFHNEHLIDAVPHYFEDGNDMLGLDAEMRARGYWLDTLRYFTVVDTNGYLQGWWRVVYWKRERNGEFYHACANTELLARALAVHKALTGKEWKE